MKPYISLRTTSFDCKDRRCDILADALLCMNDLLDA